MSTNVVIRLPEVLRRIGISRSKLYADVKSGEFPSPISLGARAVGWLDTDVDAWIASRVEAARSGMARDAQKVVPA